MTTEKVFIESAPKWTWMLLITVCLTLVVIAGVKGYNDWRVARKETRAKQQAVADSIAVAHATMIPSVEALVLMHECLTPCSAYIDYRAKVRTDGHPLQIKFPGVAGWIDYLNEGSFVAPIGVEFGEVFFKSPNKKKPNVLVQVYKKITVQGGQ